MHKKLMYCFSCYLSSLVTHKLLAIQYSIDIATEQSFRYMKLIDAKIWNSKNASLCQIFVNWVIFMNMLAYNHPTELINTSAGTYLSTLDR